MSWQDKDGPGGADGNKDSNKDKGRRNPWGQPENRPGPAWGQRAGQDSGPPDLDEFLRKAKANFNNALPGGGSPVKLIILGGLAVILLWLASGFYFVQPDENGVVLTLGKYTRTDEQPGLKYRIPWPIQSTTIVPVTSERRIQIGFRDSTSPIRIAGVPENGDESLMLTGDENIVDIDFVVLWRIGNAKDYLFSIRNPEDTIKLVAESAMREVIGQIKIQAALTEARGQIQDDTRKLMQSILDEYKAGVIINNVQLQKVDPPTDVVDAFNDVQRARQEKEKLRNEAEAYRNDIIPRAKGESEQLRQQAQGYQQEVVNRAKGDADRFTKVYEAYRTAEGVTAERMYIETMEQILQNSKIIFMDSGKSQGVMPYMPLNELQRAPKASAAAEGSSLSDGLSQPSTR